MNQILLTDTDNNKKKSNSRNTNRNSSNDIKKIIVFFSVVILVFGVAIGGVYGYKIFKNSKEQEVTISKPELSLQEAEEGAEEVIIIAESEVGISKIIYTWNDEEKVVKELNGRTKQEEPVEIPLGENTLKVKVIDLNGQEQETTQYFERESEVKPTIETSIIENAKLKIVATSELPIKYIEYKWNDEEKVTVNVQNEGDTSIETIIDVKRGRNILTITAVDSEDNSETIDKTFNGVNNPIIEVTKEEEKLYMKVSHDMGFKQIIFYVNGKTYNYDENFANYDAEKKVIEYYFNLKEGENIVVIKAISTEETEAIYKGKCDYTVE